MTGLVLEGGGVRGIYTAGVLDVFMEHGIGFDGVIGVSAGAIHGCSYMSGQKGRSLRYYMKYCGDPRFMSLRSWITTGDVVGADFCYHELPDKLDVYDHEGFRNRTGRFYVVCSNVETGRPEYPQITDMRGQIDLLRASATLPYLSRIVQVDGKKLLDGGCTDSIPVEAFRKMGYERNVVIRTRPRDHRRQPEHRVLGKLCYGKYPAFVEALRSHHRRYNETAERLLALERTGEVFMIAPEAPLAIGRLEKDPQNVQRVYDIGRKDGQRNIQALCRWLETEA